MKNPPIVFIYSFLAVLLLTVFSSCDDTGVEPVTESLTVSGTAAGDNAANLQINAGVIDWSTSGYSILAEGTVSSTNSFSLEMPAPPVTTLRTPASLFYFNGTTVSDPSAKVSERVHIRYFTSPGVQRGEARRSNNLVIPWGSAGHIDVYYLYADKPVTITGTYNNSTASDTSIINYNLTLQKGWNIMQVILDEIRGIQYSRSRWIMGDLSTARWEFMVVAD
jgi:hypothetical protein